MSIYFHSQVSYLYYILQWFEIPILLVFLIKFIPIQNNFFRFIIITYNIERHPHIDYNNINNLLNLKQIEDEILMSLILNYYHITNKLNIRIDYSHLVSLINLNINCHNIIKAPCLFYKLFYVSLSVVLFFPYSIKNNRNIGMIW